MKNFPANVQCSRCGVKNIMLEFIIHKLKEMNWKLLLPAENGTDIYNLLAVPGHALLWLIPVQRKLEHATWKCCTWVF
jgi:hypothetical protein